MRLAPRLILSFGVLAAASSAGLGIALREDRRTDETERFDSEVRSACARVASEVARQADGDRKLVGGACQAGELVDRALVAIDSGELDERRLLVGEVDVEAAERRICEPADLRDRRAVVPLLAEDPLGRAQDPEPRGLTTRRDGSEPRR